MRETKAQIMNGVTCDKAKIVANNTVKYTVGDRTVYRLHQTDIISEENGVYTLNSGGCRTPTTKERINRFSPAMIYQQNSIWYIDLDGQKIVFHDQITVDSVGKPIGTYEFHTKELDKNRRKLLKLLKSYSTLCADSCPIPEPSGGDCWDCLFEDKNGKTMGEISRSSHIMQHIKERYVVPSLVYRACERFGISQIAGSYLAYGDGKGEKWADGIAKRQISSAVYRYLKTQFNLAG